MVGTNRHVFCIHAHTHTRTHTHTHTQIPCLRNPESGQNICVHTHAHTHKHTQLMYIADTVMFEYICMICT